MNGALKYRCDVDLANRGLRSCEAKEHPTEWKNWDMWDFLTYITKHVPPRQGVKILDAGCASSPLLWNLAQIGYRNLEGIDFDFPAGSTFPDKNIKYTRGDLTRTHFDFETFDAVTCLSVIEHGVDPEEYMREMSRILKPGGFLLTSTDYWPEKISTRWVPKYKTFGLPWTILDVDDVHRFLKAARRWGLDPVGVIDFHVEDKVVKWGGKEYTFFSFVLRKRGVS